MMDIPDDYDPEDTSDVQENNTSNSGGGGGRGGGRRSTIRVKRKYGTKQYPPDSVCEDCGKRAVGVMIIERTRKRELFKEVRPLCGTHRDQVTSKLPDWDVIEFRRFVDA